MAETNLNAFGEQDNTVDTEHVKCTSCGSNMVFDPDNQTLYCEHCSTVVKFNTDTKAQEIDLMKGITEDRKWKDEEIAAFTCDNCGAKVVLSNGETASECPFCGTSHVQKTEHLDGLKPNALLPFTFGSDKAVDISVKWAKKKFFAPKKFKKNLSAKNVKGVYAPSFTFDSYTTSTYVGRIGTTYTRTVGSGKNQRTETYTVWRNIAGTYFSNFDDILMTAGKQFDQKRLAKISPFDTNSSKSYDENYMLGFMAYQYDFELGDCWEGAKIQMDGLIERGILRQYSYDKIAYLNVSTTHENVTYKYVMLPVYVGSFRFKKKNFNFFINGTTGKTWGKYPKSAWKIIFTILGSIGLAVGLGFLFALLFG